MLKQNSINPTTVNSVTEYVNYENFVLKILGWTYFQENSN